MAKAVLDKATCTFEYCKELLCCSKTYIENYYKVHHCNYVEHRIYNPKTYLLFENARWYELRDSAKIYYHYIDVDPNNILSQYQIMLVDSENINYGKSMFNSVYPIIMLKNRENKIVGILKPEDNEIYKMQDEHMLIYRKYKSITSNYECDMYTALRSKEFHCYPFLSNITCMYITESSEKQEQ